MNSVQETCAEYLGVTYLERLAQALEILPAEDLWWRPHPECISFGTILLHLEGNVRQWILAGLLGQEDRRQRAREFQANGSDDPRSGAELLAQLQGTAEEAAAGLRRLTPAKMQEPVRIQGFDTSVQDAVLHVVEHFSWHVGQAVWIAKARAGAGHGLAFYGGIDLDV